MGRDVEMNHGRFMEELEVNHGRIRYDQNIFNEILNKLVNFFKESATRLSGNKCSYVFLGERCCMQDFPLECLFLFIPDRVTAYQKKIIPSSTAS